MTNDLDRISNAIKKNLAVIGLNNVTKLLRDGLLSEVFVSSNRPDIASKLMILSKKNVKVVSESSKELGVRCKKPFNISVIGILMDGKK